MVKESLVKEIGLSFIVRILGAGAGFVMSLVVARSLSSSDAGLFFLGFAIFSVLGRLSTLGLTTAFVRYISIYATEANWGLVNGVFVEGVKRILLASILAAVVLCIGSSFISDVIFEKSELGVVLRAISFSISAFSLCLIISFAFQGLRKPRISILLQNIFSQSLVIFALVLALFLNIELDVEYIVMIFTYSWIITCVIALMIWFLRVESRLAADYSQTASLLGSAKPLWVAMLMTTLVQWSGQVIAGMYVPVNEVAYLSVAQRTAMLTSFILVVVNLVAAPRFAVSAKLGRIYELRAVSKFCSRLMLVIATPIMVVMFCYPEFFMGLFGESYKEGVHLLQVLLIGQFVNVMTGSVGFLLNMAGFEKDMRNVVFFSGFFAVLLAIILIPEYGVLGAAIATSVALASQNLLAVLMVRRRLGFNALNIF